MRREDILIQCLSEIETGDSSVQDVMTRYPELRDELEPLVQVSLQLEALPKTIVLSEPSKGRIRAQLMAEIRQPVPAAGRLRTWMESVREIGQRLLVPQGLGRSLARPAAIALTLLLSFGLVGAGTVSAAMESIPGDDLYPVKTAAQRARLALAFTPGDKADTYLWIASSRVEELSKMADAGRIDLAPKVIAEYEYTMGEALRLASNEKQEEVKFHQQVSSVQTGLQEVYDRASQDLQIILTQAIIVTLPDETGSTGQADPSAAGAALIGESGPTTSGLPSGGRVPSNKSGVVPDPTPTKGSPISNQPPEPEPSDTLPPKGSAGPAPGPVPGRDTAPSVDAPSDTTKDGPVTDDTSPASSDNVTIKGGSSTDYEDEEEEEEEEEDKSQGAGVVQSPVAP